MDETQYGHLLLADISGDTSYVASTELTHSQETLTELLEAIITRFMPVLAISKIEGDAIFAYAPESKLPRGEAILELIESTYIAFLSRREAAHRRTIRSLDERKTHFTLTFKAHLAYVPEWFKRLFCRFVLRVQVFKLCKLQSINDLVAGSESNFLPTQSPVSNL